MFSAKRVKGSYVEVTFEVADAMEYMSAKPYTTLSGLLTSIAWQVLTSKDPSFIKERFSHAMCDVGSSVKVTFYYYKGEPPEAI